MVAIVTRRHFEKHGIVGGDFASTPGSVRDARAAADGNQRLHADIFRTRSDRLSHHGRDQIIVARAGLDRGQSRAHAGIDIARGHCDLLEFGGRLDDAQLFDDAGAIADFAELIAQGFIGRNGQEPAALVDGDTPGSPAARLDDVDQEIHRLIAVLIDLRTGDKSVGDEIEIFELTNDEGRLAVDRQHQRLEGVVAGRLLAGEIEDVLRSGHDHGVDPGRFEQPARSRDPLLVFRFGKSQFRTLQDACAIHFHSLR